LYRMMILVLLFYLANTALSSFLQSIQHNSML
jgi:hypothetical protein